MRRRVVHLTIVILNAILCLSLAKQLPGQETAIALPAEGSVEERPFFSSRRHPAISYERASTDRVGELVRKVDAGDVRLRFEGSGGYLISILESLDVPVESQSVVFSKTSLQAHWISPKNPRAIYYSDDVSVAFIRNAPLLEISALDPTQGVVFYSLEQRQAERPRIVRSDSCLSCHESRKTLDVPGILALSVGVGDQGETLLEYGNYVSDHRSPFEERWGGWFITGQAGSARHMGNVTGYPRPSGGPKPKPSLSGQFDLQGYPSEYSDVAAVMVLNHQVRMTNLLTRVAWETRVALDQQAKRPSDKQAADRLITANARELADYMLFVGEPALQGKFESTSGFRTKFETAGPRDRRGRSLRQLDLSRRLLRYPCSYMIYSHAFDALPAPVKAAVYARLWDVFSGKERDSKYSRLSRSDRAAIVGILLETKTDLPPYFKPL